MKVRKLIANLEDDSSMNPMGVFPARRGRSLYNLRVYCKRTAACKRLYALFSQDPPNHAGVIHDINICNQKRRQWIDQR